LRFQNSRVAVKQKKKQKKKTKKKQKKKDAGFHYFSDAQNVNKLAAEVVNFPDDSEVFKHSDLYALWTLRSESRTYALCYADNCASRCGLCLQQGAQSSS
jgi:hypothetical protein